MEASSTRVRRARPLLGTFVELVLEGLPEEAAHRAAEAAFEEIAEVQRRMSFHDPGSVLSEVNRRAAAEPVTVDEQTFAVLECAAEVWRISAGAFDLTVAPLLQRLGFLPGGAPGEPLEGTASLADVALLSGRRVRFAHPGVRLDLGGIAKGYAVDRAVASLCAAGVPSVLVNAGGDLRAAGIAPFAVVIRDPRHPLQFMTRIELRNAGLATSAHYFAERMTPGAEHGPIFEPQSGAPALSLLSATVSASTAMLADALTKVVMLRGPAASSVLEHFGAAACAVSAQGMMWCSGGWPPGGPTDPRPSKKPCRASAGEAVS